jgi:CubicO group peptidase (beta-lactamase class C family)
MKRIAAGFFLACLAAAVRVQPSAAASSSSAATPGPLPASPATAALVLASGATAALLPVSDATPASLPATPARPAPLAPDPAVSTAAVPAPIASVAAALDAAAEKLVGTKHVPGIAVAVAEHGAIVFERGYGTADVAKKTPVTVDTRFEIGSVTKQVTAACILQLARAGKLSLDDHLGTFVPDYFIGRGVTVRQLLAQTSGIPEYLDGPDAVAAAGAQPATAASLLARVSAQPLEFAPGTAWKYSNTNYILLGRIVEVASREPYERYVREHVFAPAGMTESGFIADEPTLPEMARGYAPDAAGVEPAPPFRDDWAWSAGAIVSTVGDVVKWDDALLAGKIVALQDVALMRTAAPLGGGVSSAYGFGWIVDSLGGHVRIWHNGGTFGFHSVNATFPKDDQEIVVLENSDSADAEALATTAFSAMHPDVASALTTAAAGEDQKVTARLREWLRRFETGDVDRGQLTDKMSTALTPDLIAKTKSQFATLGDPQTLVYKGSTAESGDTVYTYFADFAVGKIRIVMALDAAGKIDGYFLRLA